MKKLLSILLTIIFFQTQVFAFSIPIVPQIFFPAGQYDNDSSLRTGLPVDATGAKVTLKEQGKEKEQLTKATIGKGTIIVGGKEQTSEDLKDLNRDTTKTQELTKDQITAALDADLNVDIKLLTSLFDAAYNGDVNKISVVKDYKKAKKEINEIKQKIQEKLKSKKEEIVKQRNNKATGGKR